MAQEKGPTYRQNNIYENLRDAIIKKEETFYIDSGEILGQQERRPIEVSLINAHKEKGLISESQHSELVTLFNIRSNKKSDMEKRIDISNIRLETYLDLETAITKTHKKTFLTENTNDKCLYIEMPELICNALKGETITHKEAKKLFRLHIKDLTEHKGLNFKKDILKAIRIAYNQNVLENMDEVNFILSVIKDKDLFKFITNNLKLKRCETKEVEINKYILREEPHRIYMDINKGLLEEIRLLKLKESNQEEALKVLKEGFNKNNNQLKSIKTEKEFLKTRLEENIKSNNLKTDTIKNLEEEISIREINYEDTFSKLSHELDKQEDINESQKEIIERLRTEIEELSISKKTTISFFEERLEKLTAELEQKEITINKLEESIEDINSSGEKNKKQLFIFKKHNIETEKEIKLLKMEKAKLELKIKKLINSVEKESKKNHDLSEEFNKLNIRYVKSRMKINHLELKKKLKKT